MKKFFEKYKLGFDFWALILFALIMIPNIVYWCIPAFTDLNMDGTMDTFARIFQVIGVALLLFMVKKPQEETDGKKEEQTQSKPFFDSLFMTVSLLVLLYYAAWIIYFCAALNTGIILFLAGCPCLALLMFAVERKNYFALAPLAIFSVLHILSAIQIVIAISVA